PAVCIGVVSRLSKEKGIDRLIKSAPAILSRYPDTRFLIVGDGAEKPVLETMSKSLGIADAFEWSGLQPKEMLPQFYRRMDIVAVPSRFEGFGLTAIEAMSHARSVVASNVDGLSEVVEDGLTGVLFDPESPDALTDSINYLIEFPDERDQMGTEGYSRVKALFSYNIYQKTISDIYSHLS
ncbi:glycosyltransferase family 4 protein, partial [Sulfuricurvum sp.]|uniref:glycosyltransferase family 4 protein n=1 Tax=Sulfuricurvum sp. TaxID=2025608 RepID=UPI00263211DA